MQLDIEEWLTSSLAGGHAKETALPVSAAASPMTEAISGGNSDASSSKPTRLTSSRKTSAASFPSMVAEISESSSVRWPTRGMMLGGRLTERPTSEPRIAESASGSTPGSGAWPTPHSNMTTGAGTQGRDGGMNIQTAVAVDVKEWASPRASDANGVGPVGSKSWHHKMQRGQLDAQSMEPSMEPSMWDTPTVNDAKNSTSPPSQKDRESISQNVLWATPCAVVGKDSPFQQQETLTKQAVPAIRGDRPRLNAAWVSQVMGWPDGWIVGLPPEVFGRLAEERRSTRGKRRASSKSAPKGI